MSNKDTVKTYIEDPDGNVFFYDEERAKECIKDAGFCWDEMLKEFINEVFSSAWELLDAGWDMKQTIHEFSEALAMGDIEYFKSISEDRARVLLVRQRLGLSVRAYVWDDTNAFISDSEYDFESVLQSKWTILDVSEDEGGMVFFGKVVDEEGALNVNLHFEELTPDDRNEVRRMVILRDAKGIRNFVGRIGSDRNHIYLHI